MARATPESCCVGVTRFTSSEGESGEYEMIRIDALVSTDCSLLTNHTALLVVQDRIASMNEKICPGSSKLRNKPFILAKVVFEAIDTNINRSQTFSRAPALQSQAKAFALPLQHSSPLTPPWRLFRMSRLWACH